jgi:hypothetical protein
MGLSQVAELVAQGGGARCVGWRSTRFGPTLVSGVSCAGQRSEQHRAVEQAAQGGGRARCAGRRSKQHGVARTSYLGGHRMSK